MLQVARSAEQIIIRAEGYALVIQSHERRYVRLEVPPGRPLADLILLSSAHPPGSVDELTEVSEIVVERALDGLVSVRQEARGTVWSNRCAELICRPEGLVYRVTFRGAAAVDELHLFECSDRDESYLSRPGLSGYRRPARGRDSWSGSRAHFPRVFSPAPNSAGRTHFWSGEHATNHPANEPGFWGGDWFFTPAPFAYGLGGDGRWLTLGLAARPNELDFGHFDYRGGELWGLSLSYRGTVRVDGAWTAPATVMLPSTDEYAGLAAYCDWLDAHDLLPPRPSHPQSWWREPIWCGWGEQVAREGRMRARDLSSRRNYDRWLAVLGTRGISPGTIVVDDRWQARLGDAQPANRWPDLTSFIAEQHAVGRRVLIWHNVWELESPTVRDDLILRDGAPAVGGFGYPMLDPTAPGFDDRLRRLMADLLAPPPVGLSADGLKLDITHSTPLGTGYTLHGSGWGNGLLYRLLRAIYAAAKDVSPDCLVESHSANPYFRDTCDVLRLNDISTDRASVVPEMIHRARVARAAGFDLVDTDGWALPSRAALIEYAEAQPALGIPALYYATRVDRSGERFHLADYRNIAAAWERYRRTL